VIPRTVHKDLDKPGEYRQFSLLALFPRQTLEGAPRFIHLGTQFLREYQAQVALDCSSMGSQGRLIIP